MKKLLTILIIASVSILSAKAQNNPPNDKNNSSAPGPAAIIDKLWEAMRTKNADGIRALFAPEGQFVAIEKTRSGEGLSKTRVFNGETFTKLIVEGKGEYVERMPKPEVKIFGDAALVFGRYTFHLGDKFSHCGTNIFNLIRIKKGWRIANGLSTLEFECKNDLKAAVQSVKAGS